MYIIQLLLNFITMDITGINILYNFWGVLFDVNKFQFIIHPLANYGFYNNLNF